MERGWQWGSDSAGTGSQETGVGETGSGETGSVGVAVRLVVVGLAEGVSSGEGLGVK